MTRERVLGLADIAALCGVTQPTVRQWKLRGKLPPPDQLVSGRTAVWYESTIAQWLEALASA